MYTEPSVDIVYMARFLVSNIMTVRVFWNLHLGGCLRLKAFLKFYFLEQHLTWRLNGCKATPPLHSPDA